MRYLAVFVLVLLMVGGCQALLTTNPATLIGSNNVTLSMAGAATTCWFQWGMLPGAGMTWRTPNQTPVAGACTYRIFGSPLIGNELFYFRACDVTGCDGELTFTTATVTPIPSTTYGNTFVNLTENNFDITFVGGATMQPYMWLVPGFEALIWGLIFMFVFIGMWLRGREIGTITILGFIIGVLLFSPAYGLDIGIPPEFAAFGQGIAYACVAGFLLSLIKK